MCMLLLPTINRLLSFERLPVARDGGHWSNVEDASPYSESIKSTDVSPVGLSEGVEQMFKCLRHASPCDGVPKYLKVR